MTTSGLEGRTAPLASRLNEPAQGIDEHGVGQADGKPSMDTVIVEGVGLEERVDRRNPGTSLTDR